MRENRLRRTADRHGYRLLKSRSRDPQAIDYGLYALISVSTNGAVNPAIAGRWVCSWDLDEVEDYLTEEQEVDDSDAALVDFKKAGAAVREALAKMNEPADQIEKLSTAFDQAETRFRARRGVIVQRVKIL